MFTGRPARRCGGTGVVFVAIPCTLLFSTTDTLSLSLSHPAVGGVCVLCGMDCVCVYAHSRQPVEGGVWSCPAVGPDCHGQRLVRALLCVCAGEGGGGR